MEIQKYQNLLSDIEIWLKTVNIPVNTVENAPTDEATVIDEINEYNFIGSKIKEKLQSLKDIQSNCENLAAYSDVQPLASTLSEQLSIILSLINEQQIIIMKRTEFLQVHLQQLREQPVSIQSTDNTLDSAISAMPEDEIVEPKVTQPVTSTQVYEVETQTSESLQKPSKQIPIDEEQQTSFPIDDKIVVETFDTSVQTLKEKKPTDNISVIQTFSDGHETIKFESAPNPTISEITEDVFVDAKYQQVPPGESIRTSELVLRNVPQSFETTFTEPDETTTEVVCDPDGTKRIIVRKVTRTRQHVLQQSQQQQFTTVSTLMGADNVPVTQSVSQINLENQVSTNTVTAGGGTKTTISKQGKGMVMAGTSPDSMVVHEFEHEPVVEEYITGPSDVTLQGIPMQEGDVVYVDKTRIPTPEPLALEPGYEQSSIRAVVQQVTRRIIRKTRKIIKRVVVIDGVEHVTEEVVEEPEEIEITEEEVPQVNVNIVRTVNGKVTTEQYEEQVPQSGVSTIITHIEDKMQMKGDPIKDVKGDTQVFEIIQAPVELVIVDPAPVDITSETELTDGKLEPSQVQQIDIVQEQETVENIDNIWPHKHHLEQQGLEISERSVEELTISEPSIKEDSVAAEEIWPQNLNTGSEFVLETYEFDAKQSSPVIDEIYTQTLIEEIDIVEKSENKSEQPELTITEVEAVITEAETPIEIQEVQPINQPETIVQKEAEQVLDVYIQETPKEPIPATLEVVQSTTIEVVRTEELPVSTPPVEGNIPESISSPVEDIIEQQIEEHLLPEEELVIAAVKESVETIEELVSSPEVEKVIATPVEELIETIEKHTPTPAEEVVVTLEQEENVVIPEQPTEQPTEQSEVETVIDQLEVPEKIEIPKDVVEVVTSVTIQEKEIKETETVPEIPEPSVEDPVEQLPKEETIEEPKEPAEEIPLIKPIPTIDVRLATHLFLEAEAVAADPHTQTIKVSLPAKGTQSPGSVTVTMKVDADEEQPKVNVNLVEETHVPVAIVGDAPIDDSSKSDGSKRSRKKKKRKDKETPSKEESQKSATPEELSIDPSAAESVELIVEDDNTISEHMEMPEEQVYTGTPPSDRDNVQETGYEPIDETAEEDHKDDQSKKKKRKKKQKVKAIADDESIVPKSAEDESRGDDTPLESESEGGVKHEEEKEITPDESLKSISEAPEDSVKIIEESIVSSPSESPKPLVTEVIVTKSVIEETLTEDVEQQTSPVEMDNVVVEQKATVSQDVRSVQTSPEQKESTVEISLQTSPEPITQLEHEMQTSPTEQSEAQIQTTPVKFDDEERVTIEQTSTEIQTDVVDVTVAPETIESSIQTTVITTEEKELQTSPTETPRIETAFPTEDIVRPVAEQLVADICNKIPIKIPQSTEATNTDITTTVESVTQTSPIQFAGDKREVDSPSLSTSTEEPYEIQIEASFTVPDGGVQSLMKKGEPVVMEIKKSFHISDDGIPVEVFDDVDDQKKKKKKNKIKKKKGDRDAVDVDDKTKIDETRKFLEGEQYPKEIKESIFEPESQPLDAESQTATQTATIDVTTTIVKDEIIPVSQEALQSETETIVPSAPTLTEITESTGPEQPNQIVTLTIEKTTVFDTKFEPTNENLRTDEVIVEEIQETQPEPEIVTQPQEHPSKSVEPMPDAKSLTQTFLVNEQYNKVIADTTRPEVDEVIRVEELVQPVPDDVTVDETTDVQHVESPVAQLQAESVESPKDRNVSLIITKTEVTFVPPTDIVAESVDETAHVLTPILADNSTVVNTAAPDRKLIDITKSFIDGEQYEKPAPFQSISVRVVVASTEPDEINIDQQVSHDVVPIDEEKPTQKENLVQLSISKTTVTDSVNEEEQQRPAQQNEEKLVHQKKPAKSKATSSVTIEEVMSPTEELVVPLTPGLDIAAEYERVPDSIWTSNIMQNRAPPSSQDLIQAEIQDHPNSINQRPTTLVWKDTDNMISNRIRQMNNVRAHLGDVVHLATLSDAVTEEPVENRIAVLEENLGTLQEAVDRHDTIIIQRSVVTVIETISTWLETIEYRVYRLRQQSNDGPSEENIRSFDDLKDELHLIHGTVAQFAKDLQDAGHVVSPDERDKMNKCFATLSDQVKTIEEVTVENEVQSVNDLQRWNEYIVLIEQIIVHITNLQERFETIVNTEIKTDEKLVLLDDLENRNQEQGKNIARILSTSRSLMRDFPNKQIPREVYGSYEASRNLENNIFLERNRLLQLQTLAAEYEQTLNEFTQITLLADTLVEQPIVASTLEALQQEMQKHRKFFVNLSHCRSILESLEENLDNETRIKHAELHKNLYGKASAILGE